MGELDEKSLIDACKRKLSNHDDLSMHVAKLRAKLEDEMTKPDWYPFKVSMVDGNLTV